MSVNTESSVRTSPVLAACQFWRSALTMWARTGKPRRGALQDLADAESSRITKITKNQKPSQRSRQALACFTLCLLTCFLPFSHRFSNRYGCLSSLVVGCCALELHSMFTHHSLFSASIRRLNQLLFVLLSSFLTHILKSKLLPFFSCCWLLHTGTTLHVYSPFFFSLRRSNHFLVVLLSCCLAFFLSSSLLKLIRLSFFSCCWLLCAGWDHILCLLSILFFLPW